ncbi:cyanophycinase [Pseudoalteromonas pernae]|uniref:cyanophycinase n=1 Tax=Pseudoalteromonas pernae TaxID=3118054 RepID=UPI003241FD95
MIQFCTFFKGFPFSKKLASFFCFLSTFSLSLHAKEIPNSTLLIGGSLHTCSSMSDRYCVGGIPPFGKENALYLLSKERIETIDANWPANRAEKENVIALLTQLSTVLPNAVSLKTLKQHWFRQAEVMYYSLSDDVYYFVLDNLEIQQIDSEGERLRESVDTSNNKSEASNRILKVIENAAKRHAKPLILSVTASSRDPYESADFYEGLLSFKGVQSEWLALTPASAKALANSDCDNLRAYRVAANTYNREDVYPDRTFAEQRLCRAGIDALKEKLDKASVIMFNGGDQSLTRQVFFDDNNHAYPWTQHILNIPMIVGTSAGTAVQSGGSNQFGTVPMISNGTSIQALVLGALDKSPPSARCSQGAACKASVPSDALTYEPKGGLGRFNLGVLDTHFSERGRTLRLFTLLKDTHQKLGFGIDETTALLVSDTSTAPQFAVIGKSGVVVIEAIDESSFYYSYWPQGVTVTSQLQQQGVSFAFSTGMSEVKPTSVVPSPSMVDDLLNNSRLRTVTQQMCQRGGHHMISNIQLDERQWRIEFKKSEKTRFYTSHHSEQHCAINQLKVSIKAN